MWAKRIATLSQGVWTPSIIVGSTALWLDAADAATITQSSGAVSAWRNKGVDGSSWDQATGLAQPSFSATGFDGIRPAITSDGSADVLQGTIAAVAQPFSVFMAISNYTGGTGGAALYRGNAGGPTGYRNAGAAVWSIFGGSVLSDAAPYTAGAAIRHDWFNGASSLVERDGGAASFAGNAGTLGVTAGAFNVFAGQGGTGGGQIAAVRLGEMLIVRSPSTDTRDRVTGYLAWKWGLQGNLPAGHPFRNATPRV
jgi:hypothetical protein